MNQWLASVAEARIARPTTDLERIVHFYVDVVGFDRLGGFQDHNGYDGGFVGVAGAGWHIEFTQHPDHTPTPSVEDLLVVYLSSTEVDAFAAHLASKGLQPIGHPNPYWAGTGARTFIDPDGYGLVLCPQD